MHWCEVEIRVRDQRLGSTLRWAFGLKIALQKGPKKLTLHDRYLPFTNADTFEVHRTEIKFCTEAIADACGDEVANWRLEIAKARDEWIAAHAEKCNWNAVAEQQISYQERTGHRRPPSTPIPLWPTLRKSTEDDQHDPQASPPLGPEK